MRLCVDAAGSLQLIEFVPEAASEGDADAGVASVCGGGPAASVGELVVYPARHYVTSEEALKIACASIKVRLPLTAHHFASEPSRAQRVHCCLSKHSLSVPITASRHQEELYARAAALRAAGNEVAASRIEQRTLSDLKDIAKFSYCNGMENYSRHLAGRPPGAPPTTLLDYLWLSGREEAEAEAAAAAAAGVQQADKPPSWLLIVRWGIPLPPP